MNVLRLSAGQISRIEAGLNKGLLKEIGKFVESVSSQIQIKRASANAKLEQKKFFITIMDYLEKTYTATDFRNTFEKHARKYGARVEMPAHIEDFADNIIRAKDTNVILFENRKIRLNVWKNIDGSYKLRCKEEHFESAMSLFASHYVPSFWEKMSAKFKPAPEKAETKPFAEPQLPLEILETLQELKGAAETKTPGPPVEARVETGEEEQPVAEAPVARTVAKKEGRPVLEEKAGIFARICTRIKDYKKRREKLWLRKRIAINEYIRQVEAGRAAKKCKKSI